MSSTIYNRALLATFKGQIDWDGDSFKMALFGAGYTPDVDADEFRDDLSDEATGTGYDAGGKAVDVSVTLDAANDRLAITIPQTEWVTTTIAGGYRYAVVYQDNGNAAADRLIAVIDHGSEVTTNQGTARVLASTVYVNNNGEV